MKVWKPGLHGETEESQGFGWVAGGAMVVLESPLSTMSLCWLCFGILCIVSFDHMDSKVRVGVGPGPGTHQR
jgi:hypothetical protein